MHNKKIRRLAIGLAGFVLSGIGLWYVFHEIDPHKLIDSARRIKLPYLAATIALYWCGMVTTRSLLIRHLLNPVGKVPIGKVYRYICIGYLANNVLPLRMGEVVRIGGIARVSGINFASVTGGLAVERLLDMTMTIFLGIAAVQVAPVPQNVRTLVLVTGCGLVVAFAVFVFLARRGLKEIPQQEKRRIWVVIWNLVVRFSAGLGVFSTFRGILYAITLSAIIWCWTIAVMQLRLVAFDLPASLPLTLVLLTSIAMGVSLPSAPGYIGVYHAFAAGALILLGVDEEVAVGFAIFSHLVDIVPSSLFGATCMIMEGLSWTDLKASSQAGKENKNNP